MLFSCVKHGIQQETAGKHWLTVALFHINVTCYMQVVDFILGLTIQYYGPLGGNVAP